jgi:hypothetical protein
MMVVIAWRPRSARWAWGVCFSLSFVLVSFSASAQISCGDATKDVPTAIQEQLKGDVQGKAQLFTKLLGTAEIKGTVDASRTELYEAHKDLDQHQIDMYFMWISCQTISSDKSLQTKDKLKLWEEIHSSFASTKTPTPSSVNIIGSDNVVSVGQIGGITARVVTVITPPLAPELRILGRQDVENPDGSHTVAIKTQVVSPVAPGLLAIQVQAEGLKSVAIMPPAVGGVSTMMKRNVRQGPNFYSAEIPSPRGEYDIGITTERPSGIRLDASF